MNYIFDLDHTVVDSSPRQATRPDGSLDLDHWREHSTPAMIEADTLLPLAHEWRKAYRKGHGIIVCTARVMGVADYRYLTSRGLFADKVISRADKSVLRTLQANGLTCYDALSTNEALGGAA